MVEKGPKPTDTNSIEKHLGSKLFQKFLQKEGNKLSESSIIPPLKPEKFENPKVPIKKSREPFEYYEEKKPVLSQKFSEKSLPKTSKPPQRPEKRENSPKVTYDDQYYSNAPAESPREVFSKQQSLKFQDYPEEKPQSRNKWQDPEPYSSYKEEVPETFYTRDSELKGFSDYIPPGESFVYFESIPENPPPKPKPQPYVPYYPVVDPLIAINNHNQQIKDFEERLKEKDDEIFRCRQDLENARLDYTELEEKMNANSDMERRMKNLRVEKDMFERKAKNFEDENFDLIRQLDNAKEDLENAKFKIEDLERAIRSKAQDYEREIRGYKDRISDLERDLAREKEKNSTSSRQNNKKKEKNYEDDYRNDDRGYYDTRERDYYDDPRDNYSPYEDRREKYNYHEEDNWKPSNNKKKDYDSYPERQKNDFYDRGYQEKGYQDYDQKKPEKFSDQVKARVGATNSSSVSSVLNWGEKPKKNEEVLNIENKILALQIEKKRFEEELAKIPEHAKKIAVIRRREEVENELAIIHSNIANLKIKAKQLQAERS